MVTGKLREFAHRLRSSSSTKDASALRTEKEQMMAEIHRIVTASLGEPPSTFDWVYRTKEGKQVYVFFVSD